jgi:putative transcriptional regulator
MFQAITINREELTIMGVEFEDSNTFESTANALGSNMFEGFEPTPKGIRIIKEYVEGQITLEEMVALAKARAYV